MSEIDLPSPKPGFWTAPAGWSRQWLIFGLAALFIPVTFYSALSGKYYVAIAFSVFSSLVSLYVGNARLLTKQDTHLMAQSDDLDVCLVEVTFRVDGRVIGTDRGLVYFENGALVYVGHRTSFVLSAFDFAYLPEQNRFVLHTPDCRSELVIVPLPSPERMKEDVMERIRRFAAQLNHLVKEKPVPTIERQWPPLAKRRRI